MKSFDVIIIGGSYAGLAAAMALGRAMRKVLVIDSGDPCNRQTPFSHNFLTNDGKTPKEIGKIAREEVARYETVIFLEGEVIGVNRVLEGFEVRTRESEVYNSKILVFATGIKDVMPAIPGVSECWGISVLHCPYCHGYEERNQKTGLLANGESGYEFSTLLSNWTSDLTLFTNGKSTLTAEQTSKLEDLNIIIDETEIKALVHKQGKLQHIFFGDGRKVFVRALYMRVPFVQHCTLPASLGCEMTKEGYIQVNEMQQTSLPGVFACGDNSSRMRTVANGVAAGTTTGMMVNKMLVEKKQIIMRSMEW
jgi:thioredoxin reductase